MFDLTSITSQKLKAGELEKQLPWFYDLKNNYEFNPWHDETTFDHVIMVFEEYEIFLKELSGRLKDYFETSFENYSKKELFKLVILLHDIAKSETLEKNEVGETFFPHHEKLSAEKSAKILSDFDLSAEEKNYIIKIVEHHAEAHNILGPKELVFEKFKKLQQEYSQIYPELIVFGYLDTRGCKLKKNNPAEFKYRMEIYRKLLAELS